MWIYVICELIQNSLFNFFNQYSNNFSFKNGKINKNDRGSISSPMKTIFSLIFLHPFQVIYCHTLCDVYLYNSYIDVWVMYVYIESELIYLYVYVDECMCLCACGCEWSLFHMVNVCVLLCFVYDSCISVWIQFMNEVYYITLNNEE